MQNPIPMIILIIPTIKVESIPPFASLRLRFKLITETQAMQGEYHF